MRILVTGGSGYLGTAAVAALRDRGHDVVTIGRRPGIDAAVCDLANEEATRHAVRAVGDIDTVVHLAARAHDFHGLTLDVADRHVLIVDDILDTGKTLSLIAGMVRGMNPASLRVCVLLDKKGRRQVPFEADLVGFEIPDKFVVGYGLDFAERYRNLTHIGVLKSSRQKSHT